MRCSRQWPLTFEPDYCIVCEMRSPRDADGRTAIHAAPTEHVAKAPRSKSYEPDQPTAVEVRLGHGRCRPCAERRHTCEPPCNCPKLDCGDVQRSLKVSVSA
jgi:hypothetical protein